METQIKKGSLEEAISERAAEKRNPFAKLSYYAVPLIMTIVFIAIIAAGIVPKFFSIRELNDQITTSEQKYADLQRKADKLENLNKDVTKLVSDLEKIEKAFPSGQTSVSQFALDIERLAEDYKLERTKITSEETIGGTEEEKVNTEAVTPTSISTDERGIAVFFEIPSKLELDGSFKSYLDYFKAINDQQKFLVLSKVDLKLKADEKNVNTVGDVAKLQGGVADNDGWGVNVTINSYNFSKNGLRDSVDPMIIVNTDFDYILDNLK